jgi:hypothetical protein
MARLQAFGFCRSLEMLMELEMQTDSAPRRRQPDWPAACVAGLVAGAVAMIIDLLWTTLMQAGNPWHTSHLVAAMLLGPDLLQGPTQAFHANVVAVALLIHYGLGIVFGCMVAFLVSGLRQESSLPMLEVVGGLFGIALYFVNFYVMASVFPWVAELRSGAYLVEHMVFGMVAAAAYWRLAGSRHRELALAPTAGQALA